MAALTSSWSAIRIGGSTIADICLVIAAAIAVLLIGVRHLRMKFWMFGPLVFGLLLMARDVILLDRPLNGSDDETLGISPLQMFLRVSLSTFGVAAAVSIAGYIGRRSLIRLLWTWVAGIAVSAVWALAQGQGIVAPTLDLLQLNGAFRYAGLTSHPNALAQSLVLSIPVLFLGPVRSHRFASLIRPLLLLLWGFALWQTGSRAGLLVGFLAVVVCAAAVAARSGALKWALPIVLAGVVAAVFVGPRVIAGTRFAVDSGASASDVSRAAALSDGWTDFLSSPLIGAGFGIWVGELAPLVMLVSGGATFLVVYSIFAFKPLLAMRDNLGDSAVLCCLIAGALVPVLGLLNNGFTERYTFWPALIGFALSAAGMRLRIYGEDSRIG
ncbi:hypothetical protein HUN59_16210 [Curtobacterium sp. Csp2]|uniref:hypothetical protein n=1 Tax=Curtobacterium sp. Csp2 TaxID=2495430 RepID=UPI00158061B2|nr:hypothetical protein [Curtobacterium sp. Csp2]QKS17546.1 hypothetical protein HUN59_16210 [Curtobacterium sp. Csp2]